MKSSKLYYFLHQCTPAERARFRDFMASPALNRDEPLREFYETFARHLLSAEAPDLGREDFFRLAYPGKEYDANLLRVTMSRLLEKFLKFLAFRQWQSEEGTQSLDLLRALHAGQYDRYFEQAWKSEVRRHRGQSSRDSAWYRDTMDYEFLQFEYHQRRPKSKRGIDLGAIETNLDRYYLISRLGYACLQANRQAILPEEPGPGEMDYVLAIAEGHPLEEVPLLHILVRVYLLLTAPISRADQSFLELRGMFTQYLSRLSAAAARNMLTHALNYAFRQLQKGRLEFQEGAEYLYRLMIDRKLLDGKWGLSPSHFKQIVTLFGRIGAQSGDYAWITKVVRESRLDLPSTEAEACREYNAAVLWFYQGKLAEAARVFHAVRRRLPSEFYRLDARAYLMMCFYSLELRRDWGEMKEKEGFSGLMEESDALRMYLRREQKVSAAHHRGYQEFNRCLRRIVSAKGKPAEKMDEVLQSVREALATQKQVPHKLWLLSHAQ